MLANASGIDESGNTSPQQRSRLLPCLQELGRANVQRRIHPRYLQIPSHTAPIPCKARLSLLCSVCCSARPAERTCSNMWLGCDVSTGIPRYVLALRGHRVPPPAPATHAFDVRQHKQCLRRHGNEWPAAGLHPLTHRLPRLVPELSAPHRGGPLQLAVLATFSNMKDMVDDPTSSTPLALLDQLSQPGSPLRRQLCVASADLSQRIARDQQRALTQV